MDPLEHSNIINYLKNGKIPEDLTTKVAKQCFKRRTSSYQLDEASRLLKICKTNGTMLICPTSAEIQEILHLYHDPEHCGVNTSTEMLNRKYAWRGMQNDIREYIKSCHECQMTASSLPKSKLELHPIVAPRSPWHHIGIDLVTDLPSNSQGYKHIIVIVCYLSKFVAARPLHTKTTRSVLDALTDIYLTYGVPTIIQHDQGKEFTSKDFKEFHNKLNVDDRSTTAYHPQANGLVEAHNKIIKRKIAKFIFNQDTEWPNKLQPACLSANIHKKRATQYSPFQLMFGRDFDHLPLLRILNLPPQDEMEEENSDEEQLELSKFEKSEITLTEDTTDWESDLQHLRSLQREDAKTNISIEQSQQKISYDKRVQTTRCLFKSGDLFLVLDKAKEKKMPGTKDKPVYKGPFQVSYVTDSHLITMVSGKEVKYPAHLSRKYYSKERETDDILPQAATITTPKLKGQKRQNTVETKTTKYKKCKLPKAKCNYDEESKYTYGVLKKTLLNELFILKDQVIKHIKQNTFMSNLHEELTISPGRDITTSNTIIEYFLRDCSPTKMREEVLDHLLEWTRTAYSDMGSIQQALNPIDYVHHVLYATVIEYLEDKILTAYRTENSPPYRIHHPNFPKEGPYYSPPNLGWLRSKCTQLGIEFETTLYQPTIYEGEELKNVVPSAQLSIEGDGNCLFRALSAILTGKQYSYAKIRAEICRYIITQGASFISRYLETKFDSHSPAEYMKKSDMDKGSKWGTDVEIIAFSSMLSVDIFVSIPQAGIVKNQAQSTWYRYHSRQDGYTIPSLYLINRGNHYEPVLDLIHSRYPSFSNSYSFSDEMIIE